MIVSRCVVGALWLLLAGSTGTFGPGSDPEVGERATCRRPGPVPRQAVLATWDTRQAQGKARRSLAHDRRRSRDWAVEYRPGYGRRWQSAPAPSFRAWRSRESSRIGSITQALTGLEAGPDVQLPA